MLVISHNRFIQFYISYVLFIFRQINCSLHFVTSHTRNCKNQKKYNEKFYPNSIRSVWSTMMRMFLIIDVQTKFIFFFLLILCVILKPLRRVACLSIAIDLLSYYCWTDCCLQIENYRKLIVDAELMETTFNLNTCYELSTCVNEEWRTWVLCGMDNLWLSSCIWKRTCCCLERCRPDGGGNIHSRTYIPTRWELECHSRNSSLLSLHDETLEICIVVENELYSQRMHQFTAYFSNLTDYIPFI